MGLELREFSPATLADSRHPRAPRDRHPHGRPPCTRPWSAGFATPASRKSGLCQSIVALESFIFGSAYDVTAPADIFDSGSMAEATPSFTGAVRSLAAQGHERPADVAFSLGLEALISGLGALRG